MIIMVTITIPTLNSAKSLARCLEAIKAQTYKRIEVNIVDSYSKDGTVELARKMGVNKIILYGGSLLGARFEGVKVVKGKYTLILDSDQILDETSIERAVSMAQEKNLKMLVFEEEVSRTESWVEKLFDMDRKLFNTICDLDPFTGVILPRFFDTSLLKEAYSNIPKEIFFKTGGPDHAIVYYESWLLSKAIGVLPKAVLHIEPTSLIQFWKKFYRWGYTGVEAHNFKKYHDLMTRKEWFRTGLFTHGLIKESIGSIALSLLKGVANKSGYLVASLKK